MSDSAFRSKGPSATPDVADLGPEFVPRGGDGDVLGPGRMDGVHAERAAANSQIQRTLRAWRKENGDEPAQQAHIPEGSGRPLPTAVRMRMEPKLGADLSGARVHQGAHSEQAAQKLGARAFTVGNDVHFNAGEFNPGTKEGDRLIAHELTHVAQGQKSGVKRKAEPEEENKGEGEEAKGGAEVSTPEEPAEKEADEKADDVTDELHEGGEEKEGDEKKEGGDKKDAKGKKGDKDKKKQALDEDSLGKEPGEGAKEEPEEKKEGVKEAAPDVGAKLYLKEKDPKKRKEKEDQKKLKEEICVKKVELAAGIADRNQKGLDMVASIGLEALCAAIPGAGHFAKELAGLAKDGINVAADTKREIDASVLTKAIQTMSSTKLKLLYNKWEKAEPSLSKMKEDLAKEAEVIKKTGIAGGATDAVAGGTKNIAKEGAKKLAEKLLEFIPFVDTAMKIGELIKVMHEISSLREEIEKLTEELKG